MSFLTSHRKVIALIALFSFIYLIHITGKPLSAAPVTASTTTAAAGSSDNDGPGVIEQRSPTSYRYSKKSPIIPILIGVLVVGAIVAVLVLVVFKTKYDITGSWDFTFISTSPAWDWDWTIAFDGSKKSGAAFETYNEIPGKYKVDGKNVTIEFDFYDIIDAIVMTGKFDSKERMSGQAVFTDLLFGEAPNQVEVTHANWTATKNSGSPAAIAKTGIKSKVSKRK